MKARGLLMIEHRLIEKMLAVAKNRIDVNNEKDYDPVFLDSVIDFIKTYADRTHHGKEEDILFRELEKKELDKPDREMMLDLVEEHKTARSKVARLVDLNGQFKKGQMKALSEIKELVKWLSEFYPVHIQKEDKVFFPNADLYFSDTELNSMLEAYYTFDAMMIHEKYKKLYAALVDK